MTLMCMARLPECMEFTFTKFQYKHSRAHGGFSLDVITPLRTAVSAVFSESWVGRPSLAWGWQAGVKHRI